MDSTTKSIASVVVTFFVTWILNSVVNFYVSEKGAVAMSRPVTINGKLFVVVTFENYTKSFLDSIVIDVPKYVALQEIVVDAPISLIDSKRAAGGQARSIEIGALSPGAVTRLFIPAASERDAALVRIVNGETLGISNKREDALASPLQRSVLTGLFIAFVYAIVAFFVVRHDLRVEKRMSEKFDQVKKELDDARVVQSELRTEYNIDIKRLDTRVAKTRLLLQARLFDYAKELEFWRNTVRTLLMQGGKSEKVADTLIEKVVRDLNTHGTNSSVKDYEAIQVAARWLAETEKP
jgi:ribosomal protein S13